MYYPYLRGRQYELIGLRELCEKDSLECIVPVIEPVKASSTLLSTLKEFGTKSKKLILVQNPSVGSFQNELAYNEEYKKKYDALLSDLKDNVIFGYIMNSDCSLDNIDCNSSVAFCSNMDQLNFFNQLGRVFKLVFIPDSSSAKRKIKNQKVLFEDRFRAKNRNADYAEDDDSFFSNDLFYYEDEKFDGFSDFSIVGDDYSESGFAPYAVAIHMVYREKDSDELRIHHFVSDSNEDINNPQGKFGQALKKLVGFAAFGLEENKTFALEQFISLEKQGVYPGLGTVKKLSIMHHLELVSKCLKKLKG